MRILKLEKNRSAEPILYNCVVDDSVTPGARYGPVVRDVYIVECNLSGYGSVIINGKEFPVRPGDCYILLPGQRVIHTADPVEPRYGIYCTVGGMRFGQVLAEAGISADNPYVPSEAFERIVEVVNKMLAMRQEIGRGAELRRTAYIYELLGAITDGLPVTDTGMWVQKALGIFETDYHRPLSVADVAAEIGFERSYFSVKFKEHVGLSPHKYLTTLRIGKAAQLLSGAEHTVSEIAESVGLDPVNFARLFKKETGLSPLEYRKNAKNSQRDKKTLE